MVANQQTGRVRRIADELVGFAIFAFAISAFCWVLIHEVTTDPRGHQIAASGASSSDVDQNQMAVGASVRKDAH